MVSRQGGRQRGYSGWTMILAYEPHVGMKHLGRLPLRELLVVMLSKRGTGNGHES